LAQAKMFFWQSASSLNYYYPLQSKGVKGSSDIVGKKVIDYVCLHDTILR
jgi:hypothetical protein